ncbi:hypothetical protein F0919_13245 [Taibaiella lutea]|uniref:Lipocalin-like domain-containing protein n=1 Tax=Taibaiella lutea TaxID=2608001 RepID=A0A5M6CEG9_9BACT|nr:DUF5004 domain-containing protein [Taibaiella lutea]KAA5533501.1 hypothetical protein F0919_13245 [Taibaiella lutea]
MQYKTNSRQIHETFLLISIALLFMLSKVNAQNPDAEIIGKWKVVGMKVNSDGLSKTEIQKTEVFKNSFLKSTFVFKSDKNFSFDIDIKDIEVKNGHWKYNSISKSYIIQEWKDKNNDRSVLIEIKVEREAGKIFFLLTETPFILEVQKGIN